MSLISFIYNPTVSSASSSTPVDLNRDSESQDQKVAKRKELKQRYLSTLDNSSPSKKKRKIGPFPGEKLIGYRIRHTFFLKKRHHSYKGTVRRRALESYLDSNDEDNVKIKYVVQYDPPSDQVTYCYALEEVWYDGRLQLL